MAEMGCGRVFRLVSEILGELKISEHGETIHYLMAALSLEQRLSRTPNLMNSLGAGISAIQEHRNLNELAATDEDIISRLSRLYEETAGTLQPRIRIQGQQKHLANTMNNSPDQGTTIGSYSLGGSLASTRWSAKPVASGAWQAPQRN